MQSTPDMIRLPFPPRKYPTGKLAVSEENEILIVFKDSIGVFVGFCFSEINLFMLLTLWFNIQIPNAQLTSEKEEQHIGYRLKFFTAPNGTAVNCPVTFVPPKGLESPCSPEVARFALSRVDRVALASSTRALETKDFLDQLFRNADWSPAGVDQHSRYARLIRLSMAFDFMEFCG